MHYTVKEIVRSIPFSQPPSSFGSTVSVYAPGSRSLKTRGESPGRMKQRFLIQTNVATIDKTYKHQWT